MVWDESRTNFDRNLAVVIGIDRYDSKGIHELRTAVSDACAVADLLEQEYVFEKTNIIRLFDDQATLRGLKTLLSDTLPNQLKPTSADRLIFYYAGHGIGRNSKDGPAGYLVPQDADLNEPKSFLPMQYVYEQLSKLACHHLLVILDCCFAGTFQWAASRKLIPILETVRREHYDRFIRFPAWQVITSSAHDQEAMDVALDYVVLAEDKRGTVDNSSHSPFALALLEGLRNNRADLIPDDVITAHELYLYLEQRVSDLSKERQKPGLYPLRREYDKGEFIFTKPGFTRDQLKPAPPLDENNNPYRGLKSFDEKHARFFFGRQVLIEDLVERLLLPDQVLTVVLGVSGSGKSSLVKAGLIPHLREKQANQWYIFEPMRPGEFPFTALARVLLPIVNANLIEQLSQVSFLDEVLKQVLESRNELDRDLDSVAQAKQKGDRQLHINETLIKIAESWSSATSEAAKLLLVEDYFAQLEALCRQEERQSLVHLYQAILATLDSLIQHLQQDPQYLTGAIETWSQNHPNVRLLLIIDQFEELITMSHDSQADSHGSNRAGGDRNADTKQWQPFLETLQRATAACAEQWRVVVTLRSDFEPRFLDSPLKLNWKDARFPVRAMNSDELRDAIEGPALKQALYFEPPELVGKIIDEVGQMPGALPLLSFTLSELYIKLHDRWAKDNATDRALRIKDYEELGGVAGALTRRATQEYDNLVRDFGEESGKAYQTTMWRVMLRMVTIEGGGVARRRVPESELVYPTNEENERVRLVIDRLVKARLLVKGQETEEAYVEPAHDFLIRGWDKLQQWFKSGLENIALQQRLTSAANDWEKANDNVGLLMPDGDRLNQFAKILGSPDTWFNLREKEFIDRSLQLAKVHQIREVLPQRALRVLDLLSIRPVEGLVLAIQIMGTNVAVFPQEILVPVKDALIRASNEVRESNVLNSHGGGITAMAISPNNQFIISSNKDGTLQQWDWQGNLIREVFSIHKGSANAVAISPDSQLIASGGKDKTVRLWDIQGNPIGEPFLGHCDVGKLTKMLWLRSEFLKYLGSIYNFVMFILWIFIGVIGAINPSLFHLLLFGLLSLIVFVLIYMYLFQKREGAVTSVAFTPDGKYIVSGGTEGGIRLWSLRGHLLRKPFLHCDFVGAHSVNSVTCSPHGKFLASAGGNRVRIWNFRGKSIGKALEHDKSSTVEAVAFSPDGRSIVSAGSDKTIRVWSNWEKKVSSLDIKIFRGHEGSVTSIAFSPDGKYIVSGSEDKTIRVWNLSGLQIGEKLQGHEGRVTSVAWNSNGQKIVSINDTVDMTLRIWEWQPQSKWLRKQVQAYESPVTTISFSPNGEFIVGGSEDGTIKIWNKSLELLANPIRQTQNRISLIIFSLDSKKFIAASFNPNKECYLEFYDINGNPLDESSKDCLDTSWNSSDLQNIYILGQQYEYLAFLSGDIDHLSGLSPNCKYLVTCAEDGLLQIWDSEGNLQNQSFYIQEATAVKKFREYLNKVVEHNASSSYLKRISNSRHNFLKLIIDPNWLTPRIDEEDPLREVTSIVTSISLSPDAQWIASGYIDGMVKLWDSTGKLISAYKGHEGSVTSILFSMNGSHFLSLSENIPLLLPSNQYDQRNGTLALWNQQGYLISTYQNDQSKISSFAISPDGYLTISGFENGTLQLWQGDDPEMWLRVACDRLRYHPVFKEPQTDLEKEAYATCLRHVWNESSSPKIE